jgi:hypothetical protein
MDFWPDERSVASGRIAERHAADAFHENAVLDEATPADRRSDSICRHVLIDMIF